MSQISKQALIVDNNQSFPTNNAGEITPSDLRAFNVNMIDSLVNEIPYQSFTSSVTNSINLLNAFTSSQQPSFTALNQFTASQLTINSGYNAATQSLSASIAPLQPQIDGLKTWTGSINQISDDGIVQGYSTRLHFYGLVSASIVPNVNGAIASIDILQDSTKATTSSVNVLTSSINQLNAQTASALNSIGLLSSQTASYNLYTASFNSYTASTNNTLNAYSASFFNLNAFTASAGISISNLNLATASLSNLIDTKLSTSSFNSYTASSNTSLDSLSSKTGSYATTGSNVFSGSQTFTGSIYNSIISASIVGTTASLDFSKANFFTLTLPGNSNTFINIQNVGRGQTALLEISNAGTAATASFNTNVYQPSASFYVPTNISGSNDILTFSTFNGNKIYLASVKTMVNS
jgi:hypothetical protein